jgi:hypothetical protein
MGHVCELFHKPLGSGYRRNGPFWGRQVGDRVSSPSEPGRTLKGQARKGHAAHTPGRRREPAQVCLEQIQFYESLCDPNNTGESALTI